MASGPVPPVLKVGVNENWVCSGLGCWVDWKHSPARADWSTTEPSDRGCPAMVRVPDPAAGRVHRVMAARVTSPLPPWTAKSSAVKWMVSPQRAFLAKSATMGASVFLFQKNAETGRGRVRASASVRTPVRTRRAIWVRFKGMTSLFVDVPLLFASPGGICAGCVIFLACRSRGFDKLQAAFSPPK